MPTPGDLIRRMSASEPPGKPNSSAPTGGGGVRAVANGAPMISAEPAPAVPRLGTFRDVVALVGERKEAMLHAHLLHSVHLVRFAPPVIELRPQPEAPRDLASRLAALLSELTGTRWTIAMSAAIGEPTIAEQGSAADNERKMVAADHPLVRAILAAFPGARIDTVHDKTADAYGLPAAAADAPEMPDFAPPDAAYFDEEPMEIDP
jgi:DNA polymerase-3 subunit gamma/tau